MPGERCCQRARGDALQLPPSRGWEQGDAAQTEPGSGQCPLHRGRSPRAAVLCRGMDTKLWSRTKSNTHPGASAVGTAGGRPAEAGGVAGGADRIPPPDRAGERGGIAPPPTSTTHLASTGSSTRREGASPQAGSGAWLTPPKPHLPQRAAPRSARSFGFTPSSTASIRSRGGSNSCCSYNDP